MRTGTPPMVRSSTRATGSGSPSIAVNSFIIWRASSGLTSWSAGPPTDSSWSSTVLMAGSSGTASPFSAKPVDEASLLRRAYGVASGAAEGRMRRCLSSPAPPAGPRSVDFATALTSSRALAPTGRASRPSVPKEPTLARPVPTWLITDLYDDTDLGVIATGKEGEVGLVERTARDDDRSHLLARKRYRPRTISHKGELQELGFERAPTFANDIIYRDGRNYGRRSRDRRAVETMTKYGKELVKQRWVGHEYDVMAAAWEAGASVPYPVGYDEDGGLLLEYIGDRAQAAPRLAQARLGRDEVLDAWLQLQESLRLVVEAGYVHADLSAYNALWWKGRLWL